MRAFLERRNPFDRTEVEQVLSFADEEVESSVGYPAGFQIHAPQEQLKAWKRYFPELQECSPVPTKLYLSDGAEGWAVIPKPSRIADSYHDALEMMLNIMAEKGAFKNWLEGKLSSDRLRLTERTETALKMLQDNTPGDFLIIPIQFGMRHRGRSVRWARACFIENEFGLGPYEAAALLVTHPDRISDSSQLCIVCAGCEYSSNADGRFEDYLNFNWNSDDGRLGLNFNWSSNANPKWGSASGFGVSLLHQIFNKSSPIF